MNVPDRFKEKFEETYGHPIARGNLQASLQAFNQKERGAA